jgi:hypothetical protein
MAAFIITSLSASIGVQAEDGDLLIIDSDANSNDTAVRNAANPEPGAGLRAGYSGNGYIDLGDTPGDRLTFNLDVAQAGNYDLNVRYASQPFGSGPRSMTLAVNGASPPATIFPDTGPASGPASLQGFNVWDFLTRTVTLNAGLNTVSLIIPPGASAGPNIDRIEVTPAGTGPIAADTNADVDGNLLLDGPDGTLTSAAAATLNLNLSGVDPDIVQVQVGVSGSASRTTVTPDSSGHFVFNGSALPAGSNSVVAYVTDAAGNQASAGAVINIAAPASSPGVVQAEDAARVTVQDTGSPADPNFTRVVNAASPDSGGSVRTGAVGGAYIDLGGNAGDAVTIAYVAPEAGTYDVTFRYGNGGGTDRPLNLTVNGGPVQVVHFVPAGTAGSGTTATGWDAWGEVTVRLELGAGSNALKLAIPAGANTGPNIDQVAFVEVEQPRSEQTFIEVASINFQPPPGQAQNGLPAGYVTPAGFLADTGAAFGDRGNGFSYGWVTEASVADGTTNGTIAMALPAGALWYRNTVPGATSLQKTFAQMESAPAGPAGARAWEMGLADGTYEVTLSVGDTGGAFDSTYSINIEGRDFGPTWTPANPGGNGAQDGGGFRSTLVTGIVQVTDGRLTIDSIGGTNTELQSLEIRQVPDLSPSDGRSADLDYSYFTSPRAAYLNAQVPISVAADGTLPTGINPLSSFVVGVQVQAPNHRGPNITKVDGVSLVETLTGAEVPVAVQISGGSDSLTIKPGEDLKENTSYTLKVEGVLDLGSITDGNAPLRQMQDLTTTFVTGATPPVVARAVGFNAEVLLDGFADGAAGFTSIAFGPDGRLYTATLNGEINRWNMLSSGGIDLASRETLTLDYFDQGAAGRRGIIGIAFDPDDAQVIWVSDNYPVPIEGKSFSTPEFSGQISKITLGAAGSFVGATAEAYITGLPRSGGDHVTNSITFRDNPNAGVAGQPDHLLYVTQGSNSSGGDPDPLWGNRPERLLNATVLEIDPTRDSPPGGFNVRTEPVTVPTTSNPASAFNANGTYPGFYNPFAADAVLKIYATGVRNAYDMVWHSNGKLYVPANGSAAGGQTPDDPAQAGSQALENAPLQGDYLFTVTERKYYGHPNTLRHEYVMNGGNPTAGSDPNEVVPGPLDRDAPVAGYAPGTLTDPNYDLAGTYSLGFNQSPNGAIEYTGNVFGAALQGAILVTQFSTSDTIRILRLDESGKIIDDDVLTYPNGSIIDDFTDPLDIIEDPATGQIYVSTLDRRDGSSQLVLLTPVPGAPITDITADEGGDLALSIVDGSNPGAVVFAVAGLDSDIETLSVSLNSGPAQTVTLNEQNRFTLNASTLSGAVEAQLTVTDDAGNDATATAAFTAPPPDGQPELLLTIQAEDNTPGNGTSVALSTGSTSQIATRTASNPESGGTGLVGGLRPGAFGLDGNNVNTDGIPGGYADFGSHAGDFVTFSFSLTAEDAGSGVIRVRYSNGSGERPLEALVNGVSVGTYGFSPPPGLSGDTAWATWQTLDIPANLLTGTNTVMFRATANTGPNIDQIEVLTQPGGGGGSLDPNADIAVQSLDPGVAGHRLVFSYLEDANAQSPSLVDRAFKTSGTVHISNTGSAPLNILHAEVEGPFVLANPSQLEHLTLAAGQSIDVAVNFNRSAYAPPTANVDVTSTIFEGALRLTTNDAEDPVTTVQLAGFWQARDEGGQEPNVNEVWKVFGYGNVIENLSLLGGGQNSTLNDFDLFHARDATEVLSPYWRIADGYAEATVTQVAAFHGNGVATVSLHAPGDKGQQVQMTVHAGNQNQTLLPDLANGQPASRDFTRTDVPDAWLGDDVFGISVDALSTDPRLNPAGAGTPPASATGIARGYNTRVFEAVDQEGHVIPDTYLLAMDYTGINYDYNDNMVVVQGITPVGLGPAGGPAPGLQVAFNGAATPVGSVTTIPAWQFDFGGQNLAFNDTTPTVDQGGNLGRNEGVDIYQNNVAIGNVVNGEWVEYTLNVAEAGAYRLGFAAALAEAAANRSVTASFEQAGIVYETASPVIVNQTGGWTNFQPTASTAVDLQAGLQVLRLTFNGGSENIQSVTLTHLPTTLLAATDDHQALEASSTALDQTVW